MAKKKEVKKGTFNYALFPGVKKGLEKAAEKRRLSASALLETLIIEYLDRAGIKWTEKG